MIFELNFLPAIGMKEESCNLQHVREMRVNICGIKIHTCNDAEKVSKLVKVQTGAKVLEISVAKDNHACMPSFSYEVAGT